MLDYADDDVLKIFNIFPQGFIDGESFRAIPLSRKVASPVELRQAISISPEEREARRILVQEKNRNRFSRKNVTEFVERLIAERDELFASEIPIITHRDMIRIIFIKLYGYSLRSSYTVISHKDTVCSNGFRFQNFKIKRREIGRER